MIRKLALRLALVLLATSVAAQEAPTSDDLLALSFYVQQKDQAATAAELRRLQLKYPHWTPPKDLTHLSATGPTTEIQKIYSLIAAGQLKAARDAIAATEASYPDWHAPEGMMTLLTTAEGQAALDAALDAGKTDAAIQIASGTPGLLACDRINNAWRIADAQQAAGKKDDALSTYRAVLSACTSFDDISATLSKANAVADRDQLLTLFAEADTRFPDRLVDLSALQTRLLAGRGETPIGAKAQAAKAPPPAAKPAPTPLPQSATTSPAPAPTPATGASGGGGVHAAAAAGDWAQCLALSTGAKSSAIIYERAWCAYNLDRPMEALSAFQTAIAGGVDPTRRRDASFGMALAYLKMHLPEAASKIDATTDFTSAQRLDIEGQILDQRGVDAYKSSDYANAIRYLNALETLRGGLRRDLAILRAYAYLNSGNTVEAHRQFELLDHQLSTPDTVRGKAASDK